MSDDDSIFILEQYADGKTNISRVSKHDDDADTKTIRRTEIHSMNSFYVYQSKFNGENHKQLRILESFVKRMIEPQQRSATWRGEMMYYIVGLIGLIFVVALYFAAVIRPYQSVCHHVQETYKNTCEPSSSVGCQYTKRLISIICDLPMAHACVCPTQMELLTSSNVCGYTPGESVCRCKEGYIEIVCPDALM